MNTEFAFFKCISTSEKMVIPPAVVSRMQQVLTNTVILRDVYSNLWTVGVHKNGDEWSFSNGWPEFYEDNSLEPGNFMVFDYKGTCNLFDFKLFGSNACETKGIGARYFQVDNNYQMQEDRVNSVKIKINKSKNHESESSSRINEFGVETLPFKLNSKSKSKSTFGTGTGTKQGEQSNKKNLVSNCYGSDIFNQGLTTRPKNPFFVLRSRTSRKNDLPIPKNVIEDYKLDITNNMKMYLVDESGNRWETRVKCWGDERTLCTGGWKSLCNVNNIDKDDPCICEFVKDEGCNALCLLVRVVHRPRPPTI